MDLETKPVLKKLAFAHQALAELKGVSTAVPNQSVLVATLSLQEAKDSSAIENIITSQDDLYKSDFSSKNFTTSAAKEVHNYAFALRKACVEIEKRELIRINDILSIQETIEANSAGFRKLPGTELKNSLTGEVVYTPPQNPEEIADLMNFHIFPSSSSHGKNIPKVCSLILRCICKNSFHDASANLRRKNQL